MTLDLVRMQREIASAGVDGWLFYGFHEIDPIAMEILGLPRDRLFTRRWFYLVPANGMPSKIVHGIERDALDSLPGDRSEYTRWSELSDALRRLLGSGLRVAMQYSPENAIPYVSRVDAGTVELVRACGGQVVSSADLVQTFQAVWNARQLATHRSAAAKLHRIVRQTFSWIRENFERGAVDEWSVQQEMLRMFEGEQLWTDHPPIVALNENASSPHFSPAQATSRRARRGDILLVDLWGKESGTGTVFADITWMGVLDSRVDSRYEEVFSVVVRARDAGVRLLQERWRRREDVYGWEVDSEVRSLVEQAGFGRWFIHRTGHSIGGEALHGNGVNMDNLETRDERRIIPGVCFSVEPGIYLPEFGVRTEIDVFVDPEQGPVVTTQPAQEALVKILE